MNPNTEERISWATFIVADMTYWRGRAKYWAEREKEWLKRWDDPVQARECRKARMNALRSLRINYAELRRSITL
jgi:hypothetical protein